MTLSGPGTVGAASPPRRWGPWWAMVLGALSLVFPMLLGLYGVIAIGGDAARLFSHEPPSFLDGLGFAIGIGAVTLAAVMALPSALFLWKRGATFFTISMVLLVIELRVAVGFLFPQVF